jgi:hypothetical protein
VAGGAVAVLFAIDRLRPRATPFIVAPALFVAGASAVTAAALASAALMGLLGQGLEITLLQALEHERFHPAVSVWKWARPFFADTAPSTVAILVFATLGAVSSPLWAVPLLVALLGGALVKAQYPYNYVLPCFLIGLCAVRGFAAAIERLPAFRLRPLLYLLPLLVVPDQLGFLERASDNRHQLAILAKIEAHSGPDDAVIDNAGGALFRNHGSYYFVHGGAHRVMFRDYFTTRLVGDYRRSRALFWIHDFRLKRLPPSVRRYFREHYVEADGRLYALGFETPATGVAPTSVVLDVVRAGSYHVFPAERGAEAAARGGLVIRGEQVNGGRVDLDEGPVEVTVLPHSQALFVTALPPEVFERTVPVGEPHAKLFEFEPIDRPAADAPRLAPDQE